MSTETWVGPNAQSPSGDWDVASNWSGGMVPGPSDVVDFGQLATPYTVTIQPGETDVVEDIEDFAPQGSGEPDAVTIAVVGGLLESDFVDNDNPTGGVVAGPIVLTQGGIFYTSTGAAGVSGGIFRFGDGTGDLLDIGSVGQHMDLGSPAGPGNFAGPIEGFGGSNSILLELVPSEADDVLSFVPNATGGTLDITEVQTDRFQYTQNVLLAALNFVGAYTAGNFRLTPANPYGSETSIVFQLNPIISAGDRQLVQGTRGDDLITASGAFDTIVGNGGSDTIATGAGGYSKVIQGSIGDGATGTTTITLQGRGNAVTGGDGDFSITGGTGFTGILLGNGNGHIALGGTYNTVTVGRGTNVINAGGGYSRVYISGGFQGATPNDTIAFSGQHNQVSVSAFNDQFYAGGNITLSGGSGYGYYDLQSMGGTVTTDGLYNTIVFAAPGALLTMVSPGSGYDTVDLGTPRQSPFYSPGAYTISLSGTHNIVEGEGDPVTVTGGSGSGRFIFNAETNDGSTQIGGPVTGDTYTVSTGGSYNVFLLLDVNTNTINTGTDHATVSIQDPVLTYEPEQPLNTLVYAPSSIVLDGTGNLLEAADGPVTATGGTGGSSFVLGNGNDNVNIAGAYNQITVGTGTDTISPGSDHNTLVLNGTNADVSLQGAADKAFLNAGTSGTISGTALADLHLYVTPDIGRLIINNFLTDPRPVIDLMGGAGGYATASQAIAALTPDGHGGTQLAIGSGVLDFAGVAPTALHAGMFVIG